MTSLVRACTEHGMRGDGDPRARPWRAIEDPRARLRTGLGELYAYYRANARLLGNVIRDLPLMGVGGVEAFMERMGELFGALAARLAGRCRDAAAAHGVDRPRDGVRDVAVADATRGCRMPKSVDLMVGLVSTAGETAGPP